MSHTAIEDKLQLYRYKALAIDTKLRQVRI